MYYNLYANLTLILHFAFIVFVVFGSLLLFKSKKIAFIHIPCLLYGVYIEFTHSICPLTYVENFFLTKADMQNYSSSFIAHYLLPIIYPVNLTEELQFYLGFLLIIINIVTYAIALKFFK